jgi:hypothetical protein
MRKKYKIMDAFRVLTEESDLNCQNVYIVSDKFGKEIEKHADEMKSFSLSKLMKGDSNTIDYIRSCAGCTEDGPIYNDLRGPDSDDTALVKIFPKIVKYIKKLKLDSDEQNVLYNVFFGSVKVNSCILFQVKPDDGTADGLDPKQKVIVSDMFMKCCDKRSDYDTSAFDEPDSISNPKDELAD